MKFSYQWLQQFAPTIPAPQILMDELTLRSVEVEGIETNDLDRVVVGVVETCDKHPDADRLNVCQVNIGSSTTQVVCGGSNVRVGMKVALADVGARVRWHGEGELVELAPVKIRGVESRGMICAADEIGLGAEFPSSSEKEIVDLSHLDSPAGTPLAEALDLIDAMIDIDNKSMTHRADLFCHVGMAREIAASFDVPFTHTLPTVFTADIPSLQIDLQDQTGCRRYLGIELTVQIGDAPSEIRERLASCGVKSINNVVDITNYVMLELGQPMHAFDADKLSGGIVVRRARAGETIETLDKEVKKLDASMLVIADDHRPIAVAGVIGGLQSGVTPETKRIILESANFEPLTVRQTAMKLARRTDSSLRFEKNLSAELVGIAVTRAVELLQHYANAKIIAATDVYPEPTPLPPVTLPAAACRRLTGIEIPVETVTATLTRLGCTVETTGQGDSLTYTITPPWWRRDLQIPEDIIEEIVRLYGIDQIPEQQLTAALSVPQHQPELPLIWKLREQLQVAGSTEVYNYSFYGTQLVDRAGSGVTDDHIEILNPLSEDLQFLRVSLLPRLLETVEKNSAHTKQLQLFEIGHVYFADREVHQLGIVKTGTADSYRELRGIMEDVFTQHGIHPTAARVGRVGDCAYWNWYAGGEALEWTVGDVVLGTIGILDSTIAKQFHIDGPLAFALISIPSLLAVAEQITEFQPTSPYPSIALDLSVIVPESVRWAEVESVIRDSQQSIDWLRSLQVTDIYRGDSIPVGHKSLTFHCILQSDSETLEMPVIEAWRDAWVKHLEKSCGAVLRDR